MASDDEVEFVCEVPAPRAYWSPVPPAELGPVVSPEESGGVDLEGLSEHKCALSGDVAWTPVRPVAIDGTLLPEACFYDREWLEQYIASALTSTGSSRAVALYEDGRAAAGFVDPKTRLLFVGYVNDLARRAALAAALGDE